MSDQSGRGSRLVAWLAAGALAAVLSAAYAQYPGHINTHPNKAALSPRAIAVLEWTGSPGKPSASRIIPISVFDGEMYQPGGLYLARPQPLAVESGTEYVLQEAGIAQGLFDVNTAQDVEGYWFGYGAWRPMPPPPRPHKLAPAKVMPRVVDNNDDSRPHFKNSGGSAGGSQSDDKGSGGQGSGGSSSGSSGGSAGGSTGGSAQSSDPDRPTLRRRSSNDTATGSFLPEGRETPIGGTDPDRPHIMHGATNPTDKDFEAPQLTGTPSDLQQMIAVSDASEHDPHPFVYSWAAPGDAAKMQAQLEVLAQKALQPPPPAARSTSRTHTSSTAGTVRHPTTHRPSAAPKPLLLSDEHFKAYELTYGGGATLVFSAQATDAAGKLKYVTLIAQPDFYGVPNVIFQSITREDELDLTPRMRLVDAVDPRANNRGALVFELRGKRDRQFAIYQIESGRVNQIFNTGSLPISQTPS